MGDVRFVEDVDDDPARLWDWQDPPFLRGLRAVQPAVLPAILEVHAATGGDSVQKARLTVFNIGDGRMDWEAIANVEAGQAGVVLPVPPDDEARRINRSLWPVEPFRPQTLVVVVDTSGMSPGEHDLGEIIVRGLPMDRRRLRGSPVRVPVRVIVEGASSD
jgi:hypothetical protein